MAMFKRLCFNVFLCIIGICLSMSVKEKEILDQILSPDKYDPNLRPSSENASSEDDATKVTVYMFVRSISSIDEAKMQWSVQLIVRQQWTDPRLKYTNYDKSYLSVTKPDQIWVPDLFLVNENKGYVHSNGYIRIYKDGSVISSRRISSTLTCSMNLKLFPFDHQTCSIVINAHDSLKNNVILMWKEYDPVQLNPNTQLPNFSFQKINTRRCAYGAFSDDCLKVDFLFKRHIWHYLLQVYLPSCMMVLVSWVSFWLDPSMDVSKLIISFFTLMFLSIHTLLVTQSLPHVPYTRAIDIWTGVCITFVFATLLEGVTAIYVYRKTTNGQTGEQVSSDTDALVGRPLGKRGNKCTLQHHFKKLNCFTSWTKRFTTKGKCIDVTSRLLFPLSFILFNMTYWISYAIKLHSQVDE